MERWQKNNNNNKQTKPLWLNYHPHYLNTMSEDAGCTIKVKKGCAGQGLTFNENHNRFTSWFLWHPDRETISLIELYSKCSSFILIWFSQIEMKVSPPLRGWGRMSGNIWKLIFRSLGTLLDLLLICKMSLPRGMFLMLDGPSPLHY